MKDHGIISAKCVCCHGVEGGPRIRLERRGWIFFISKSQVHTEMDGIMICMCPACYMGLLDRQSADDDDANISLDLRVGGQGDVLKN